MEWQGRELSSPGDFVDALSRLTERDAAEFVARYRSVYAASEPDRNLGYLTGYLPADEGERVSQLIGIEHPIIGDLERPLSFRDLLELGMGFQAAQLEGEDFERSAAAARTRVRLLRSLGASD